MMLTVTLHNDNGVGEGRLVGHPGGITVRTKRLAGDRIREPRLAVTLWDGRHQVGEGTLVAERGHWQGQVSEFAGSWYVSGRCGEPHLTFAEHPA